MKVILVDDERLIRTGLEKVLEKLDMGIEVVGSYSNGLEAAEAITNERHSELDLVITDIRMPMMDGIKLIEFVHKKLPDVGVIVLSGFSDFEYARHAIHYGVKEYLLKPVNKVELAEAFRRIRTARSKVQGKTGPEYFEDRKSSSNTVGQIKSALERDYNKPFELEALERKIGLSGSYMSRYFREQTGQTLTDYLIQIRMDKAKQFLVDHPNLKNFEIAGIVGYTDPVYFNKLFKKVTGLTPKEYRDQHTGA